MKFIVDFFSDFGLDTLEGLVEKTEFPWLMSNVIGRIPALMLMSNMKSKQTLISPHPSGFYC